MLDSLEVPYTTVPLPYNPLSRFYISDNSCSTGNINEIDDLVIPKRYYKKSVAVILKLDLDLEPRQHIGMLSKEYAAPDVTVHVHNLNGLVKELERLGVSRVRCGLSVWPPKAFENLTWKYACDRKIGGQFIVSCTPGIKWPVLHISSVVHEGSFWTLLPRELQTMVWGFVRGM
jgi:hypothetical protein